MNVNGTTNAIGDCNTGKHTSVGAIHSSNQPSRACGTQVQKCLGQLPVVERLPENPKYYEIVAFLRSLAECLEMTNNPKIVAYNDIDRVCSMIECNQTAQIFIGQNGGCGYLVKIITIVLRQAFVNNDVAYILLRAVSLLCRYEDFKEASFPRNITALEAAGLTPRFLLDILTNFSYNIDLANISHRLLKYMLLDNMPFAEAMLDLGACELIVRNMTKFKKDPIILGEIFGVVLNLSYNYLEAQDRLGYLDACKVMTDVVKLYKYDGLLIIKYVRAVLNLIHDHSANLDRLNQFNMCGFVVQLLRLHAEDRELTEELLDLICAMTFENDQAVQQIGKSDVCFVLARIAREYCTHPTTLDDCCRTIINITLNDVNHVRTNFRYSGMLFSLVYILKTFTSKRDLLINCCQAIVNLVYHHSDNQIEFGEYGVFSALADIINEHLSDGELVEQCCNAISAITYECDENTAVLAVTNVPKMIVKVARAHADNAAVLIEVCKTVSNISIDNASNIRQIFEEGICELLLQMVDNHLRNADVVTEVCYAILNMSCSLFENSEGITKGGIVEHFHKAGVTNTLIKIINAHPNNAPVIDAWISAAECLKSVNVV